MGKENFKRGQYAELMTECAEHIYKDNIKNTERNYIFIAPEGSKREVDVLVTLNGGERIAFEVRDRKSVQSIDWVDQVIGKYSDSSFNYVWLCTFDGCSLSSEAVKKLKYYNIGWRDFELLNKVDSANAPVITVKGVTPIVEETVITVNDEEYEDVASSFVKGENPKSLLNDAINICCKRLVENFEYYENADTFNVKYEQKLHGIENNFDCDSIVVEACIPLKHTIYYDYFDEEYEVTNNGESSKLLSTTEKSIFVKDNMLAINFAYISKLAENTILSSSFRLNLKNIPDKYRNIKSVRFIDTSGEGKTIPMAMYGIKEE